MKKRVFTDPFRPGLDVTEAGQGVAVFLHTVVNTNTNSDLRNTGLA